MSRRRRAGVRYSSLSLIHEAAPRGSRVRRHLPFVLFALGVASLILAAARPVAIVSVPAGQTTVILTIDVSRSMCATDIEPNRLLAAESGRDQVHREPELDHPDRDRRLLRLRRDRPGAHDRPGGPARCHHDAGDRSADGGRQRHPQVDRRDRRSRQGRRPSQTEDSAPGSAPAPVPKGAYAPDIIVLLTDGASNAGPDPTEAAQQAADRGIRVYTIGFGTDDPGAQNPRCGQQFIGNEPGAGAPDNGGGGFGGGGGGGGGGTGFRRSIDEATLTAGRGRDRCDLLPGLERGRAAVRSPAPAHQPDHQARGDRDQRRLRHAGGAAHRRVDPARSGLAPAAVGRGSAD